MLRDILLQNNLSLSSEIERLLNTLGQAQTKIPFELNLYFEWLLNYGKTLLCNTQENLTLLDYQKDFLLPDILSKTQSITGDVSLFNRIYINPIYRTRSSDCLCLKILIWLHSSHPQTNNIPLAFSDGDFACLPSNPTIYYIPPSAQQSLLNLPLLFHEFGHILYACHKQEMDELVGELQEEIAELLQPASQRSDLFSQNQAKQRKKIVEVWHEWTQELFCDAVGFKIGGAAFVHAFSAYLQMMGRSHFHLTQDQLADQPHPVSWLRVKIIAERVRQEGYENLAQELENTWSAIALSMEITEDYYGYYDDEFLTLVEQTIEDMLVEADPYSYSEAHSRYESLVLHSSYNPVELLNKAWQNFRTEPSSYNLWEKMIIQELLKTSDQFNNSEINLSEGNLVSTK